jgi:hypothetical protein
MMMLLNRRDQTGFACAKERERICRALLFCGEEEKRKSKKEKKTAVFFRLKRVTENRAFNCPLSRHPPKQKKGKKYARARRGEAEPLSLSLFLSLCSRAKRFT